MTHVTCLDCNTTWTAPVHVCPDCGSGETYEGDPRDEGDLYDQVQASQHVDALSLTLTDAAITASAPSRTLSGPLVRYGVVGRTNRGPLRVRPGALRFPDDLGRVKLTREHDRNTSRGHLTAVIHEEGGIRAAVRVSDGPEGEAALTEARDRTRDAFSFDVIDATVEGDEITDALVIAIGQVGIPAYDDARIDTIAANNPGEAMTPAQRARLAELRALTTRTTDQETELTTLSALETANPEPAPAPAPTDPPAPAPAPAAPAAPAGEPAPAQPGTQSVAASMPAVPGGVPAATTAPQGGGSALERMIREVTAAFHSTSRVASITAALQDITHTAHTENIEPLAWSGELWSGLEYVPEWTNLFGEGNLTNWQGKGWRFTDKLEIQDYAGDKAEIPTDNVGTEDSGWEAARMAVGIDIDRKYFDFPNQAFISGLFQQVRESWSIKLDAKVRAYALAKAKAATRTVVVATTNADATVTAPAGTFQASDVGATITGAGIPAATTILSVTNSGSIELSANATATGTPTATIGVQEGSVLKAAARVAMDLRTRRVGQASWIKLNDEDMFSLLDLNADQVPVFLKLYGIDPDNFKASPSVPRGTVMGGVKQAAKVLTLPGSPIRVDAQNLAHGGVDEAFFGYWAIEEHHTSAISKVVFKAA